MRDREGKGNTKVNATIRELFKDELEQASSENNNRKKNPSADTTGGLSLLKFTRDS